MTFSGQQSSNNYPSTLENAAEFYHESTFKKSVTFNKWVPLSCDDIHFLIPYKHIYGDEPKISGSSDGGPFFFYNHPINFVSIRGKCLCAEYKVPRPQLLQLKLEINDGSGQSVQATKFISGFTDLADKAKDYCKSLTGEFLRINGFLQINRLTKCREIKICDICIAASCLRDELLLLDEVISVRKTVLMKPWTIQRDERKIDLEMRDSITISPDFQKEWSQLQYCSLHRYNSVLFQGKKHGSFRLDSKRYRSYGDLSNIEKQTDEKHVQDLGLVKVANYLVFDTTVHRDAAQRFLDTMKELGVDYENIDSIEPLKEYSKHLQHYKRFLLDICVESTSYQVEMDENLLDFSVIMCKLAGISENLDSETIEAFISRCMRELVKEGVVIALNESKNATYIANYQKAGIWNIGKNFVDPIAEEARKGKRKFFALFDIQKRLERHRLKKELLVNIVNETLANDDKYEWEFRKKKAWYLVGRKN